MKVLGVNLIKGDRYKGGSLPDIDTDFETSRRAEVKRYMEHRYGNEYVCSVGTFTTLQVKAAVQELARVKGVQSKETSYVTKMMDFQSSNGSYKEVFSNAILKPRLKEYIQQHADVLSDVELILGNPKSTSIHACATLIVPKKDKYGNTLDIYEWLPIRMTEEGELVSEWEGKYTESAGFLKEDILGVRQLDKFRMIFDLVQSTTGDVLDINNIPLDSKGVYDLFKEGFTADNFHFGSQGLAAYAKEVKPDCIEDLIAMIALYRPGAMKSNAHNDFVAYKFGLRQPTYDYMLESVTADTYGLYIYQEQVMKACQVLGGFTLTEADGVRKAMGKKIVEKMDGYKKLFLEQAINNGCPSQEAAAIWEKLEVFSGYGFNKSHAAAYAITGYISQWLKYHYPTQYWVTAFQYAKDSDLPHYISEIQKLDLGLKLAAPDINKSSAKIEADYQANTIYWTLDKVSFVGLTVAQAIIDARNKHGEFFSLEEFLHNVPKSKVKKQCVVNLIFAGALDSLIEMHSVGEELRSLHHRYILLHQYFEYRKESMPSELEELYDKDDWWWMLKQKQVCGLGFIDYKRFLHDNKELTFLLQDYVDADAFVTDRKVGKHVCVCGIIEEVIVRKSKNGAFCQLTINNNDDLIYVTVWNEVYELMKHRLIKDSIAVITGTIRFDNYKKLNVLYTSAKTELFVL